MKTIFGALALCGMAFALSGNAAGQTLIGEWDAVTDFCEDEKVLDDWSKANKFKRLVFDKVSRTVINDFSHMDEQLKTKNCALHTKTNYSITGNQFTIGPFLELAAPNCPKIAKYMQNLMKYNLNHIKNDEKFGTKKSVREAAARRAEHFQRIKEGSYSPAEFKVSDDNQQLWIFLSIEESKDICPGSRFGREYKRIE